MLKWAEKITLDLMKTIRILLLLFLFAFPVLMIAHGEAETPLGWQLVGEGIEYQQFHLVSPVPVNVFVARMARSNPNVTIESSIAQGRLSGGTETVSNMALRYDNALNFWGEPTIPVTPTWGSTNDVIVAINGFYFNNKTDPLGVPWSGQVHSSWYAKRFTDLEASSGFIWKMDRSTFIGGCISHPADKQFVYNFANKTYTYFTDVNRTRADTELILYTPQFDRDTNTDNSGTEVLVEMLAPTDISTFGNMPYGIVRRIRVNQGSTPIPFDHVVLSGQGVKAQELSSNLHIGDIVGIAQKVVDCTPVNDWTNAYAGVGGHWRFLINGVIYPFLEDGQANVHDPRTAIAYNTDYIFFIVADGRDTNFSEGMTVKEMAEFAKYALGATDGIMQDGGGSSTMVINGEVVNNTFCNNVYCASKVYLPLVMNSSNTLTATNQPAKPFEPEVEWDAEAQILQRLVANGMLMVVVQPMQKSTEPYDQGDPVTTLGTINVYTGPGTNYAVLTSFMGNGTIIQPLNDLGGVSAKDQYWWKVDFGAIEGWVPEALIIPQLKLRSTIHDLKTR